MSEFGELFKKLNIPSSFNWGSDPEGSAIVYDSTISLLVVALLDDSPTSSTALIHCWFTGMAEFSMQAVRDELEAAKEDVVFNYELKWAGFQPWGGHILEV